MNSGTGFPLDSSGGELTRSLRFTPRIAFVNLRLIIFFFFFKRAPCYRLLPKIDTTFFPSALSLLVLLPWWQRNLSRLQSAFPPLSLLDDALYARGNNRPSKFSPPTLGRPYFSLRNERVQTTALTKATADRGWTNICPTCMARITVDSSVRMVSRSEKHLGVKLLTPHNTALPLSCAASINVRNTMLRQTIESFD